MCLSKFARIQPPRSIHECFLYQDDGVSEECRQSFLKIPEEQKKDFFQLHLLKQNDIFPI